SYLDGQLTLGSMLYRARQHGRAQALTRKLTPFLSAIEEKLDEKTRTKQRPRVLALSLLADYGLAEEHCRAGRYREGCQLLDPLLVRLRDPKEAGLLAEIRDPSLLHS